MRWRKGKKRKRRRGRVCVCGGGVRWVNEAEWGEADKAIE